MNILVISLCAEPLSDLEFVRPIVRVCQEAGHSCETTHHARVSEDALFSCDAIILSGTALADFGYLDGIKGFDWLKECGKPVLGICAGMQALCLAFGSKLIDCEEIGMVRPTAWKKNPLLESGSHAYTLHSKAIDPSEQFEVLARSGKCIHLVKHKRKPFYGILSHPEVRNQEVLVRFLETVDLKQ